MVNIVSAKKETRINRNNSPTQVGLSVPGLYPASHLQEYEPTELVQFP